MITVKELKNYIKNANQQELEDFFSVAGIALTQYLRNDRNLRNTSDTIIAETDEYVVVQTRTDDLFIPCKTCCMKSYDSEDVVRRFCVKCQKWHQETD